VDGTIVGAAIPVGGNGVYTASYLIGKAAGSYNISATLTPSTPGVIGSVGTGTLTVGKEDATITPAVGSTQTVQVNPPNVNAGPIILTGTIRETADGSPGDISNALVTVNLVPAIAGVASVPCTVTNSAGSLTATCLNVPVEAYVVQWRIESDFYQGAGLDTVLAVYDPSLGFVTGSGSVLDNGVSADFAFSVKYQKNGLLQGGLTYIEHRATGDLTVATTSLTSMSIVGITGNTAVILGQATVGGVGNYALQATVTDNGEPGRDHDLFGLQLNGTALNPPIAFAPATITAGNIQAH
jgi:hypothetical protein